ncbi:glycosyltransferase family 4 protein [Collinsella sp. LCP19S3_B11]|uniref:glycosyltransferase family 4 protein n=1 Tax=Collinsella sp. LCP19S3_B11 TaxID=3438754 RepID=UPI003F91FEFB
MNKVLMLVNWKVRYCKEEPSDLQPPDFVCEGEPYWFFRYFKGDWDVDVVDVRSLPAIERFEKENLRFYIIQTLRVIPRLGEYDLIVSHGMQSGVLLSLWRRLFKTKAKHVVFDIGSFASASEEGMALKLMQMASKSIDGLIYHTSSQITYYRKFFPWLVDKAQFIPFGTDLEFFEADDVSPFFDGRPYCTCIGSAKRDWDTVVEAYRSLKTDLRLKIIGYVDDKYLGIPGVDMIPAVPVQEMRSYIKGALFCVLPLEVYNYSYGQMTLMQQMAMGKCVVAAEAPSLVDYAVDGESAVFYRPLDVDDCSKKLRSVIENKDYRERIGSLAPVWLRDERNEEKMAHEIESCFCKWLRGTNV